MIKGWLKTMLTPDKQESELWQGWVEVLQDMLGSEVEPIIERIDARKSLFSMKGDDLNTRINELGQFFSIRAKKESSKPILLAQRIDEIHFKGTDRPITSTFWREFDNLPARWEPLYAPIDQTKAPYGEYFATADTVPYSTQKYGDFFMTSRGQIALSINALYQQYGAVKQEELVKRIQSQFDEIISPLLPLDIVFDGFLMYLSFSLFEYAPTVVLKNIVSSSQFTAPAFQEPKVDIGFSMTFTLPALQIFQAVRAQDYEIRRFDEIALDVIPLDYNPRPDIYPYNPGINGSVPDSRMVVTSSGVDIKTMGATYLRIYYNPNGDFEDYFTNNVDTFSVPMTAAKAALIRRVIYSVT